MSKQYETQCPTFSFTNTLFLFRKTGLRLLRFCWYKVSVEWGTGLDCRLATPLPALFYSEALQLQDAQNVASKTSSGWQHVLKNNSINTWTLTHPHITDTCFLTLPWWQTLTILFLFSLKDTTLMISNKYLKCGHIIIMLVFNVVPPEGLQVTSI